MKNSLSLQAWKWENILKLPHSSALRHISFTLSRSSAMLPQWCIGFSFSLFDETVKIFHSISASHSTGFGGCCTLISQRRRQGWLLLHEEFFIVTILTNHRSSSVFEARMDFNKKTRKLKRELQRRASMMWEKIFCGFSLHRLCCVSFFNPFGLFIPSLSSFAKF